LRQAAIAISDEIWAGRWNHAPDLSSQRGPEWTEILQEIEKRVPGHSAEAYEDALFRSQMLLRR
jgi:hypothetical protein